MKQFIILILVGSGLLSCSEKSKKIAVNNTEETKVNCSEQGCFASYTGAEFINGSDVAHQFSNKMSHAVGKKLKELYRQAVYRKVDFAQIVMRTDGMGTGKVTYTLSIPFKAVSKKCDAYTSFDHVGGWNHTPALSKRKKELNKVRLEGHELYISDLKTTPEGLQEYWIQWKNKNTQADCQ